MAGEGTPDGNWPRRRERSLRSLRVPKFAPPVRNLPNPLDTSASAAQSSNPESSPLHIPTPLLPPQEGAALELSLAEYSPDTAPAATHETPDALSFV